MEKQYRLDCFGTEIFIGDTVAYSPYALNGFYKCKIIAFKPKTIEVKGEYNGLTNSNRIVKVFNQE